MKRHEGPYYGYALRDVLTDEPPVTMTAHDRTLRARWIVGILIVIASISVAFLVNL